VRPFAAMLGVRAKLFLTSLVLLLALCTVMLVAL
jgi:hypothetical protein